MFQAHFGDGLSEFMYGPSCITDMRHAAVWVDGDSLYIFYSRVYDKPESIYITKVSVPSNPSSLIASYLTCLQVDLRPHWTQWKCTHGSLLMRPKYTWEGVDLPIMTSSPGVSYGPVHELRDPAYYYEDGKHYLFYSIAGEEGIGVAELKWTETQP